MDTDKIAKWIKIGGVVFGAVCVTILIGSLFAPCGSAPLQPNEDKHWTDPSPAGVHSSNSPDSE